jgi:hypothetical protein
MQSILSSALAAVAVIAPDKISCLQFIVFLDVEEGASFTIAV